MLFYIYLCSSFMTWNFLFQKFAIKLLLFSHSVWVFNCDCLFSFVHGRRRRNNRRHSISTYEIRNFDIHQRFSSNSLDPLSASFPSLSPTSPPPHSLPFLIPYPTIIRVTYGRRFMVSRLKPGIIKTRFHCVLRLKN